MPKILFLFSLVLVLFPQYKAAGAGLVPHHGYMVNCLAGSHECLACHDGSTASPITSCLRGQCPLDGPHPIEVPYPPAGHEGEYVPVVDGSVRLLNGLVTCISCHNLENPQQGHPIVDLATTNLCLKCHLM
ncbi:hypothetical protein [Geotalea sp. SG265]|uniref:hypothetical protein n=1 Tax=Geotalea sp. SG265 TaxID=2922867 RepID=UPI001FB01908|nr:hypothetical protein [Geotalea sp. SG265]